MEVKDKVAIVTGASSGIGLATAKLLTQKGAKVALVARSKDKLEELSRELEDSFVIATDLSRDGEAERSVEETLKHFGRVDILVNNAGIGYDASIEKIEAQKFRELLELDLITPVMAIKAVAPIMREQGGGSIINISSGTALMTLPDMAAYSSTKRALVGISLTAREELKDDHISVSVVYPYVTLTDFEKNTIGGTRQIDYDNLPHPPDSPESVAEKILEAIKSGEAEVFVQDWMRRANS